MTSFYMYILKRVCNFYLMSTAAFLGVLLVGLASCVGGRERTPTLSARNAMTALPIDLTRFQVVPAAAGVQVKWETATELGCAYFEVERSADDIHYQVIGRVEGDAMAVTTRNHAFLDKSPLQAASYYRLRQVDLDGMNHVSLKRLVTSETIQALVASR